MKKLIPVLIIGAVITGCARQSATTGEQEMSTTAKGAIGGAVTGAIIGAAAGDKKGAIYGALGGAAIGAGVGNYFDRQEEALRQELLNSGVQVKRISENELQLVMARGIGFQSGQYALDSSIFSTLNGVAKVLQEYPDTTLQIIGHTDSTGGNELNQVLSERRAESVGSYLNQQGVKSGRLSTRGYGERRPIADNKTASGRAVNRRVEIYITAI